MQARQSIRGATALLSLGFLAACGGGDKAAGDSAAGASASGAAGASTATGAAADSAGRAAGAAGAGGGVSVSMISASGQELGTLMLNEAGGVISVSGTLRGLPPGEHGIHLHQGGQCTPPFESAGPHWNPTTKMHGSQNPQGPHAGDMPNITVGADSSANVNVNSAAGPLRGANGLIDADGAAVVIHAKADDLKTDPSGNSGARIACGAVLTGS
jgi:Cu-Zn family superoxide dismutase